MAGDEFHAPGRNEIFGSDAEFPKEASNNTGELLDRLVATFRKFLVVTAAQADVLALWALHTHVYEVFEFTPYLSLDSPVRRSGKSRVLEILQLLVPRPWLTVRTTVAALIRGIAQEKCVLLLDETDNVFKGDREYAAALTAILNDGFKSGGQAMLCDKGPKGEIILKKFPVYAPKAFAGIGKVLPDPLRDRCIPITMRRRIRGTPLTPFRKRTTAGTFAELRVELELWAMRPEVMNLGSSYPDMPEVLNDRQQDITEPLVVIADFAGGEWPECTRRALVEIFGSDQEQEDPGIRLLTDIRALCQGIVNIASDDLVSRLNAKEESPWGEWDRGKGLTPSKLARLLKRFNISSRTIRTGPGPKDTSKGYVLADFTDAFERYLGDPDATCDPIPPTSAVTPSQPAPVAAETHFSTEQPQACGKADSGAPVVHCDAVTADSGGYAVTALRLISGCDPMMGDPCPCGSREWHKVPDGLQCNGCGGIVQIRPESLGQEVIVQTTLAKREVFQHRLWARHQEPQIRPFRRKGKAGKGL